jgi:Putative Ig domain
MAAKLAMSFVLILLGSIPARAQVTAVPGPTQVTAAPTNGFHSAGDTPWPCPPAYPSDCAAPANDFLNSIGMGMGSGELPIGAANAPLYTYIGWRAVRDSQDNNFASDGSLSNMIALHNAAGVRFDILSDYTGDIPAMLAEGEALADGRSLLSVEGFNEPNNGNETYSGQTENAFDSGWTVSTTQGKITGTTSTTWAGDELVPDLTATNASGTGRAILTVAINENAALPLITSNMTALAEDRPFSYQIVATNHPTSYNAGGLPPGLTVNTGTGVISGTPVPTTGIWSASILATNATGTATATLTILINPNPAIPVISGPAMVTASAGTAFSYQITASNHPTSYNAVGSWVPTARYQEDLYTAVKSDPKLEKYPVLTESEEGAENDNVGLQFLSILPRTGTIMGDGYTVYADYANDHNYMVGNGDVLADNNAWWAASPDPNGALDPNPAGVDGFSGEFEGTTWHEGFPAYTDAQAQTVPRVTTETAWGIGEDGVTEQQQGYLYLHLYLSAFKRRVIFTMLYQDPVFDDSFDVYNGNGSIMLVNEPRLAATYLHNLTTILADDVSNAPGRFSYSIPNEPETVHDLLLQKSDGSYWLVVWDERPIGTGEDNVAVNFVQPFTVEVYDPTVDTNLQQTLKKVSSVPLSLSDHPLILAIKK